MEHLPRTVHHSKTTEVPTREAHKDGNAPVDEVIVNEDWQRSGDTFRLIVAEQKGGNEQSS